MKRWPVGISRGYLAVGAIQSTMTSFPIKRSPYPEDRRLSSSSSFFSISFSFRYVARTSRISSKETRDSAVAARENESFSFYHRLALPPTSRIKLAILLLLQTECNSQGWCAPVAPRHHREREASYRWPLVNLLMVNLRTAPGARSRCA